MKKFKFRKSYEERYADFINFDYSRYYRFFWICKQQY